MKRGAPSPLDSNSQSWVRAFSTVFIQIPMLSLIFQRSRIQGITPQAQRSLDGASAVAVLRHPLGEESVLVVNNQFHDGDMAMETGEGHRPRTGVRRLKL